MKTYAWLALTLPLLGCYTVQENSSAGDAVSITMRNNSSASFSIMTFDDSEACAGKKLVTPEVFVGDSRTIKVPYTREITFGTRQIVSGDPLAGKYCQGIVTFEPVPGKRYAANYTVDAKYCKMSFVEISTDGSSSSSPVEKTVVIREWKAPIFESGPSCKKR